MISVIRVCRKCGAKIFSDAPKGLCIACVLEKALGVEADTLGATVVDRRLAEASLHAMRRLGHRL